MAGVLQKLAGGAGALVALGVTLIIGVILIVVFAIQGTNIVTDIDSTASTTDISDMKTKVISALTVLAGVVTIGVLVLIYRVFVNKNEGVAS